MRVPFNYDLRRITSHCVNLCNGRIDVLADDKSKGLGGAPTVYYLSINHPEKPLAFGQIRDETTRLTFHQGDPAEGTKGITHEALIAVLIDRLTGFQAGPFASNNNDDALYHLKEAQKALQQRTEERAARGVEGQAIP